MDLEQLVIRSAINVGVFGFWGTAIGLVRTPQDEPSREKQMPAIVGLAATGSSYFTGDTLSAIVLGAVTAGAMYAGIEGGRYIRRAWRESKKKQCVNEVERTFEEMIKLAARDDMIGYEQKFKRFSEILSSELPAYCTEKEAVEMAISYVERAQEIKKQKEQEKLYKTIEYVMNIETDIPQAIPTARIGNQINETGNILVPDGDKLYVLTATVGKDSVKVAEQVIQLGDDRIKSICAEALKYITKGIIIVGKADCPIEIRKEAGVTNYLLEYKKHLKSLN